MAFTGFLWTKRYAAKRPFPRTTGGIAIGCLLTSCQFIAGEQALHDRVSDQDLVAAVGWTRISVTESYVVISNVLPGESMFTAAEADVEHPIEGELVMSGIGSRLVANSRHIEAHIYARNTGLPLANLKPTIDVLNLTTGEHIAVESTLMQDVAIGAPDIHYGNNVVVAGDSDIRLTIVIGDEEVSVDGHLD